MNWIKCHEDYIYQVWRACMDSQPQHIKSGAGLCSLAWWCFPQEVIFNPSANSLQVRQIQTWTHSQVRRDSKWLDCALFLEFSSPAAADTRVQRRSEELWGQIMCSVNRHCCRAAGQQDAAHQVWDGGLLTLALFACSAHRLIARHSKYSATFLQTPNWQPRITSRNSTRESHHNPALQLKIFQTFMLPLWGTTRPTAC